MAQHRTKEEKLHRTRLGSRYFGFNLGQFYWECLRLVAASEQLTETDIVRGILRSWSDTLPPAIQAKARYATSQVEAWKAKERRTRKDVKLQARWAGYTADKIIGKSVSKISKRRRNHARPCPPEADDGIAGPKPGPPTVDCSSG